jgi:hypothetical protein
VDLPLFISNKEIYRAGHRIKAVWGELNKLRAA